MVVIADLSHRQRLHVMLSDRYSIRNTQVFDEATERFISADDIEIMED